MDIKDDLGSCGDSWNMFIVTSAQSIHDHKEILWIWNYCWQFANLNFLRILNKCWHFSNLNLNVLWISNQCWHFAEWQKKQLFTQIASKIEADSFAGVCLQICQKTREHNEGRNITNRTPAETEDFYFQLWLGGSKASWWALRKLCCLRAIHGGSRTNHPQLTKEATW